MSDRLAPRCPVCGIELTESDCECDGIICRNEHRASEVACAGYPADCVPCPISHRVDSLDSNVARLDAMERS